MTKLADVFKLNPKGLNVRRGLGVLVVMGVPLIVCHAINRRCTTSAWRSGRCLWG